MKGIFTSPSPHYIEWAIETRSLTLTATKRWKKLLRNWAETTMNPENRTLLQVDIEDAVEADQTFDMLMGALVPPRRRFIQTHAKEVRNLDV